MYSGILGHSAIRKRCSTEDNIEKPREKISRSGPTSNGSVVSPSSPPQHLLSSSLRRHYEHLDREEPGLRLPFALSELVTTHTQQQHRDIGYKGIVINTSNSINEQISFHPTPRTSPLASDLELGVAVILGVHSNMDTHTGKTVATDASLGSYTNLTPNASFSSDFTPIETSTSRKARCFGNPISSTGQGAINLVHAKTGKIISMRDPRGGFGYEPDVNFTPENSFDSSCSNSADRYVPLDPAKRPLLAVSLFDVL